MGKALLAPLLLSAAFLASCSGTAYVYVLNDHDSINIDTTTYWEPTIEATVNGETKYLPWGAEEEWVIEWIGFKLVEDVNVRATVVNPQLSAGGSFKSDFQVADEDEKYVTVSYCSGWAP